MLAILVCGIGLAAVFGAKSILGKKGANAPIAGLGASGSGAGDTLNSGASDQLVAALQSGDTEKALSVLQSSGSEPAATMQATAPTETGSTMQNTAPPAASTMDANKGAMPDDVRRWLEHLHRTEQARIALASSQLQSSLKTLMGLKAEGSGTSIGDEDDPQQAAREERRSARAQQIGGDMQSMQQAWRTLLATFDSVQAPAECVGIKGNYDQVIGETGKMITQIVGQIRNASNDPQGALASLTSMQGTSNSRIDTPARATDDGVANVCKRYDVSKWFSISSDVGGGSMAGLGF